MHDKDLTEAFLTQLLSIECPPKILGLGFVLFIFEDDMVNRPFAMINRFGTTLVSFSINGDLVDEDLLEESRFS